MTSGLADAIASESFLEYAFLRWVLTPAATAAVTNRVHAQTPVSVEGHNYRLDYEIRGAELVIAVELDGYAVHGTRTAFTYDRMRQNDVAATGRVIARFSYDAIRTDTARCVAQLQVLMGRDPLLATMLAADPVIETPLMDPDPLMALSPSPRAAGAVTPSTYFADEASILFSECSRITFVGIAEPGLRSISELIPSARTLVASADNLSALTDEDYDLYVSLRTYNSSFFETSAAASEARRVLKPGATFIVSVANGFLHTERENCVIPGLIVPGTDFVDLYRGVDTARLIRTEFGRNGFKDIQMTPTNTEIYLSGIAG